MASIKRFHLLQFIVLSVRISIQGGRGSQRKKQDRNIAPLSLPLLYRYHV